MDKNHNHIVLSILVLLFTVAVAYIYREEIAQAATYTFTQASWAGGVTANTATHSSNQSGWTQYSATSTSIVAGAGGVSLLATSKSVTDDGFNITPWATVGAGPQALAFDTVGNLYSANSGANSVSKITPSGVVTTFASGLGGPRALAFDPAGNLYAANFSANSVSKITPSGVVTTFATVGASPQALAFDTTGNLYTANTSSSTISKITPSGVVTTFASGLGGARALAFDTVGNLYSANGTANSVSKITPSGVVTTFATVGASPQALAFDTTGNLYTANTSSSTISKITPSGTVTAFVTTVVNNPVALAFDTTGNLYVANNGTATVSKITPAGTASIFATVGANGSSLVFDTAGNLYTASSASNTISKLLAPSGGFEAGTNASTTVAGTSTSASISIAIPGLLTALSPATIASGDRTQSTVVSPDGSSVYAANYGTGNIYHFSRAASTGLLTLVGTIAGASAPVGITISSDGKSVYVANYGNNTISMYARATSTGTLTALSPATIAAGLGPSNIGISPDGTSVYVPHSSGGANNTVSMFSRSVTTGLLTALATPTVATLTNSTAIVISPDGNSAYVTSGGGSLNMYSRDSTGLLVALSPATIATSANGFGVAVSPDGLSVYSSNYGNIYQFNRATSTGLLTALNPATIATGAGSRGIVVSPDGNSVYTANDTGATVSQFSRNSSTGLLTAYSPASVAAAASPYGIAISPDGASIYVTNNINPSGTLSMFGRTLAASSGTFTSAVINTGAKSSFTTLSYASTLNGQTLTLDARAGNTATPDGTWTGWTTGIASGGSISAFSGNQYIQYRANFSTTVPGTSPTLDSVTVNYVQYATTGNLTSSVYDASDAASLVSNIIWTETGTSASETVKFQARSSPDNITWSNWCGASTVCDGTDYFTVSTGISGGLPVGHPLRTGGDDRYLQYKVFLVSGGAVTPTLTNAVVQYVVNAPPEFDATYGTNGLVVSQITDTASANYGKVSISYKIRDTDTTTGTTNPGFVTPSFEYSTNGGSSWTAVPSGALVAGDTSNKAVDVATYNTYTAIWTATSTVSSISIANAKVRVSLNDNEAANSSATAISANFTLDTTTPVVTTATLDSSTGGVSAGTVNLNLSDSNTLQYRLCNDSTFPTTDTQGNSCAWTTLAASPIVASTTSWVFTGSPADEVVYFQVRDLYGNVASRTMVAPALPGGFSFSDISNTPIGVYREFLNWSPFVATTSSTFASYKVYHSLDNFATAGTLITTITDSAVNYYPHNITNATTSLQYYKVVATNTNGDISNYTATLSDIPDGSGGADTSPPYIPLAGIAVPTSGNTSANITFSTYTDSSLSIGELSTSTVKYGSYSGAVPSTCPSARVDTSTYTVNHSIYLTGLTPATSYYFCVIAKDVTGNTSVASTAIGGTFTTVSGPIITNVTERELTDVSALIFWNTNTSSDSKVYFANTAGGVNSATPTTVAIVTTAGVDGVFQHQVGLTGLSAGQTYYYKVSSTDAGALSTTDNNNGQYYSFVTLKDTTPPTITGTSTPVLASDAAVVVWQTDELSTTKVDYGTAFGVFDKGVAENTSRSIYHVATLSSGTTNVGGAGGTNVLTPVTLYYYRVTSKDAANNISTSDGTFTTPSTGTVTVVNVVASASQSGSGVTTDTASPVVSSVDVSEITPFGATLKFSTNEDAFASLQYGVTNLYGGGASDSAFTTSHSVKLRGLTPGTEYHIKVIATDKSGNLGSSSDQTFKTTFISENLKDRANIDNIEAFQKEIEEAIESILPSLVPPFISKPQVSEISEDTATISFKTNIKSFPVVVYAEEDAYDEKKENPYTGEVSNTVDKGTSHEIKLTGLKGNTKYHIQARAFSIPKVVGKSADLTFITRASKILGSIAERKKDSFTVTWITEQPTSSTVEYRNLKSGITERKTDSTEKLAHSMKIENLPNGTKYEVNLSGLTKEGNLVESSAPISVTTSRDVTPPVISMFKVDNALVPGRTDRIQTIVSWVTDEPTNSIVYYEEGSGTPDSKLELASKSELQSSYVISHSIILPSLKPGSIYRLKVVSSDDSGNTSSFGPRTVITPKQTESITDIIFKNFEDSFKFLRKI